MIAAEGVRGRVDQEPAVARGEPPVRSAPADVGSADIGAPERPEPSPGNDAMLETSRVGAILASIRHHRRALAAVALAVLVLAAIAFALTPRRYTAQADLWLDHGFERLASGRPAAAAASNSPLARNTEVRLLASPDLARGVVDRLGLANVRGIGQPKDGPLLPVDRARRQATDAIVDNLAVDTNDASYAVAVHYTAADPVLATGILNNLIESYVAERRNGGARGRAQAAMQAQVQSAREAAIRDQAAITGFREAIGLHRKEPDRAAIKAEIASLDGLVKAAVADQTSAEARLRAAQGGPGNTGITSPRIRELRARQTDATTARGADTERGSNAARLAEIGRDLAAEAARVTRLSDVANAARDRVVLLRTARTRASDELKVAEATAAQLRKIDAEAKTAQVRYDDFARRYQTLVSARRSDPGTAYVISRGAPGTVRRFPDPTIFALGGLIAAAIAAGVAVLLLEALTKGFRTRHQLEKAIGKPVIGLVPDLARVRDADFPADDPMGPPDYLYNHRHSAFSAAFRSIHTGLRLGVSGKSLRSIAICSALQGEGKTTVALCLARSAAMAGLRVVLVDCDARRPAASQALSPYVKTGLAHVLEDGVEFRRVLQVDVPSGASFLAQSNDRAMAAGLAGSARMAALIGQLEAEFDLVLLDTAPVLALAESRELAAMAGGVLLVARARETPVDATRIARKMLEEAGANVVAAALTRIDP